MENADHFAALVFLVRVLLGAGDPSRDGDAILALIDVFGSLQYLPAKFLPCVVTKAVAARLGVEDAFLCKAINYKLVVANAVASGGTM